jgi:hypothetical protein
LPDHEVTILYNRLQVILSAAELGRPQTVIQTVKLIELQLARLFTRIQPAPDMTLFVPLNEVAGGA